MYLPHFETKDPFTSKPLCVTSLNVVDTFEVIFDSEICFSTSVLNVAYMLD